ncbi:uncharacterized protein mgarpb [Danio rerio]|uniref:Uncharacterized protein mgarpb n=1 Tax=Danio rerio TaxID=7955 RepID=A0A8M1RSA4_DANRE|nr:uncharacterized protein mgarp isoform X2 [Danio rerio]|eukprot:XP_021326793.1 uncharacterized protein mgarp isoform X2 [Danio rerio]
MMFCRAAWRRLAPLARKTLTPPLSSNAVVPIRQMSFGLPVSGTNMAYAVLCGSSLTAAIVYAYKTINSDSARYNERIAQIEARTKRAVAEVSVAAEAAAVVESTASEHVAIAETTAVETVVEVLEAEAEESPAESLEAAVELEAGSAIVQAVVAEAEEPAAPVVEDVAAEAAVAETTVTAMSDLMSAVKILAGSTVEIAAASVGDQHLVTAVRLSEDHNTAEILNGLDTVDVKAEDPEPVGEAAIDPADLNTAEQDQLSSALHPVDKTTVEVADDNNVDSEANDSHVAETDVESLSLSEGIEMENTVELLESTNPVEVMTAEDDTISGAAESMTETVEVVHQIMEEYKALYDDLAGTETEHTDLTEPPDMEMSETVLDEVEETKPAEASEEDDESGNVTMTMPQA